jgi:hypothetical protein
MVVPDKGLERYKRAKIRATTNNSETEEPIPTGTVTEGNCTKKKLE